MLECRGPLRPEAGPGHDLASDDVPPPRDRCRARPGQAILHEAPETLVEDDGQQRERAPEELLELTQSSTALHAALAKLSPMQRQMIGLTFFRGFWEQEIAAHARLPSER